MIVQCRSRRGAARARASAPTVSAADFPICCDDPVARRACPPAPADIIHRPPTDRPSSIVAPEMCEQQSAKTKRRRRPAAAAPARAGRSARRSSVSQLAGIGGASRACVRERVWVTRPISDDRSVPRSPRLREREQAPPTVSAADFPICCDDPVPRCACPPAPADIIIDRPDRPSSIVAPNLRTTIR